MDAPWVSVWAESMAERMVVMLDEQSAEMMDRSLAGSWAFRLVTTWAVM